MSNFVAHGPKLSVGDMRIIIWVETGIATVFVLTRGVLRLQGREKPSFDDGFVLFALCCMIVSSALYTPVLPAMFLLSDLETGRVKIPPPDFMSEERRYLSYQFAIIVLFWATIWSVKGSFLAFYKQIFSGQFIGWQRAAWYVVAAACIATWIGNFVLQFFACVPFQTYFNIGSCNNARNTRVSNDSLYYATASDIFTDLCVMALPLSILWELRMNKKTKMALGLLFLTGFIIILFAILRLVYTKPRHAHVNPKWLAVWSSTESCIAVGISCAPPFRKFVVRRGRLHSSNAEASASRSTEKSKSRSMEQARLSGDVSESDGP